MDSWEGELAERHILATYVPVHVYDAAPVEAVLEVYSDVTELVARMESGQWKILAAVLGAMTLVYALLQLILARYQRLLGEKERERAAQEERIRYQAYHDALTGLPNRASFTEHLEEAMRRAKRAGWPLGLLFLDLDLFKRVNDSLGHDAGDRLLRIAAERIRRSVREADMLFRMGGDEFTVLLEDVRGAGGGRDGGGPRAGGHGRAAAAPAPRDRGDREHRHRALSARRRGRRAPGEEPPTPRCTARRSSAATATPSSRAR